MLTNFLIFFFTWLFLLMPLLVWLYLYEYFSHEYAQRRHIVFWMLLWSSITLPITLSSQTPLVFVYENIFSYLSEWEIMMTLVWLLWSIFVVYGLFFFFNSLLKRSFWGVFFMLYSVLAISILSVFTLMVFSFLSSFGWLSDILLSNSRTLFGTIFSTFMSLVWYYLIVSLLEESWKFMWHLTQVHKDHYTLSLSHFLTFSVSVAVWFSFFENILYTVMYYSEQGIGLHLLSLAFLRWCISLGIHILCALLFSLGMWYFWNIFRGRGVKDFFMWWYILLIVGSIIFHTIFNLSLTFGYILGVFLVFVGLYFVVAYIVPVSERRNAQ